MAGETLLRLEATVREAWKRRGWHLDTVADLARVLRPAGTVNRKKTQEGAGAGDDDRPDLGRAAGLRRSPLRPGRRRGLPGPRLPHHRRPPGGAARGDGPTRGRRLRSSPPTWRPSRPSAPSWRQARAHPERETEPYWLRRLSIIGRCAGGQDLAHDRSRGHPGYSPGETEQKLARALAHGPATCAYIEERLGFAGCASCVFRGTIKTPLQLGRDAAGNRPLPPEPPPPHEEGVFDDFEDVDVDVAAATARAVGLPGHAAGVEQHGVEGAAARAAAAAGGRGRGRGREAPPDDGAPPRGSPRPRLPVPGWLAGHADRQDDPFDEDAGAEDARAANIADMSRSARERLADRLAAVPPLPPEAALAPAQAQAGRATYRLWLGPCVDAVQQQSPRTPRRFAEAVAVAVACIVVARRVCLPMTAVRRLYTTVMLILAGRSTLFAKSEALDVIRALLRRAQLSDLLLPSTWTPAALTAELAVQVPQTVREGAKKRRDAWLLRHRHGAQRSLVRDELGYFFEESAKESHLGSLPLLLKLDASPDVLDNEITISRGEVTATDVAVSLIGAATPASLRQAARGSQSWETGLFARLLLLDPGAPPVWATWEEEPPALSPEVVAGLVHLDAVLPEVWCEFLTEEVRTRGRGEDDTRPVITGAEQKGYAAVEATLGAPARKAWERYGKALFDLEQTPGFLRRLDPVYGRLPTVALRLALLFATLEAAAAIPRAVQEGERPEALAAVRLGIGHWAAAQTITEDWRASIHHTLAELVKDDDEEETRRATTAARAALETPTARLRQLLEGLKVEADCARQGGGAPSGVTRTQASRLFGGRLQADALSAVITQAEETGLLVRTVTAREGQRGPRLTVLTLTEAGLEWLAAPADTPPPEPLRKVRTNSPDLEEIDGDPIISQPENGKFQGSGIISHFSQPIPGGANGGGNGVNQGARQGPEVGDLGFPTDGSGAVQTKDPVAVTEVVYSDVAGAEGWFYFTNSPETRTAFPVAHWLPQAQAEAQGLWVPSAGPEPAGGQQDEEEEGEEWVF